MPIRFDYDEAADIVRCESTGVITVSEMLAYFTALARAPWLRPGMRFLADARAVRDMPRGDDLRAVATAAVDAARHRGSARVAIVVPGPALYGVVRQLDAMSAVSGATIQPFYDADEALDWLVA